MQNTQTTCLVILSTIAVGFSLYYLQTVLLPFVIAVFIVIGCRPILEFVESRLKLPRSFAFIVTFAAGLALLLGFAFFIWVSVNDLSKSSDAYKDRLNNLVTWMAEHMPKTEPGEPGTSPATGVAMDPPTDDSDDSADQVSAARNPTQAVEEFLRSVSAYIQSQLGRFVSSLSSLFSYAILILIFVFFLLLGNSEIGGKHAARMGIVGQVETQIRKYLVMKTVISIFTGLAFGLVLWMFGVPLSVVFGFLAFLLNYIPNIGPLIACVLPIPFLVLNAAMSPASAITCFVLISAIQFISGNVIETRIMGKSFDVNPVVLLMALMFFGLVWGIPGMFLATPIVSIIKIVFQQRESTRKIADLMAGRLEVLDS